METMEALCSIAHAAREDEVRDCLQRLLPFTALSTGRVGIVACQRAIQSNPEVGVCRALLERPEIRRNVNHVVPANCSGGAPTTLLRAAVLRGADFVRLLLALPEVDLNSVCSDGSTPLHLACSLSRDQVLLLLLNDRRVDLAATTLDHRTALHCACAASWVGPDTKLRVVRMLVKAAAADTLQFLNARDSRGRTALHYAAENNHAPVVAELLDVDVRASDNSAVVLAQDSRGRMAVHLAAKKGHREVVRLLLCRAPSTLYSRDNEALTPLQHAVRRGHLLILQDWVPHCASPLQPILKTFVELLKLTTHYEIAVFLLKELGQQLRAPSSSLTRWAIESHSGYGPTLIPHILKWQPHLANEILDQERNQTPLHVATISGRLDVVQALCKEQGWSLITNRKDKYNKTALDYAHDLNYEHLSEHLAQRADTKEYITKLQRERDAYVAGANAILIVAVLIAGASFVSCVKPDASTSPSPPLQSAPTSPLHLMIQTTFLTSMAATTLGACASLPFSFGLYTGSFMPTSRCHSDYIGHKVGRVRVLVALASYFLLSSLASMVYSFLCASELGVSADVRSLRACKMFTVTLASFTLLVLAAYLGRAQYCKSKQLEWRDRMSRRVSFVTQEALAVVRQDSAPKLFSEGLASVQASSERVSQTIAVELQSWASCVDQSTSLVGPKFGHANYSSNPRRSSVQDTTGQALACIKHCRICNEACQAE